MIEILMSKFESAIQLKEIESKRAGWTLMRTIDGMSSVVANAFV